MEVDAARHAEVPSNTQEAGVRILTDQPQPQPVWPAALAATSALQQALGLGRRAARRSSRLPATRMTARRFQRSCRQRPRTAAHAGLGQHQLDLARGLVVAGERGDDRAHLLVAGEHEEGRRPAIALHPGEVEAGLRLRELARAVRAHGAAACTLGSISGASAGGHSSAGSSASRTSRRRRGRAGSRWRRRLVDGDGALAPAEARRRAGAGRRGRAAMRKPVSTLILPLATSAAKAAPSPPRAESLSLAPPPHEFSGVSPRSSQTNSVPAPRPEAREVDQGADAEWPAPSTATLRPA